METGSAFSGNIEILRIEEERSFVNSSVGIVTNIMAWRHRYKTNLRKSFFTLVRVAAVIIVGMFIRE